MSSLIRDLMTRAAQAPIHVYRWTLKPLIGNECRHQPSCSEYGLDALRINGPWRGVWLTVSRIARCRPGGSSGYDPAPDISAERHTFKPWRYGHWRKADQLGAGQPVQPETQKGPGHF